jgi:hypothetical protein
VVNLIFNWTGIAGQTCQLEYKDDLTSPTWTPLGSPVTGNGGTLTTTNNFGASSRRFFRPRLVNQACFKDRQEALEIWTKVIPAPENGLA